MNILYVVMVMVLIQYPAAADSTDSLPTETREQKACQTAVDDHQTHVIRQVVKCQQSAGTPEERVACVSGCQLHICDFAACGGYCKQAQDGQIEHWADRAMHDCRDQVSAGTMQLSSGEYVDDPSLEPLQKLSPY